jgi:hypothetical protein
MIWINASISSAAGFPDRRRVEMLRCHREGRQKRLWL